MISGFAKSITPLSKAMFRTSPKITADSGKNLPVKVKFFTMNTQKTKLSKRFWTALTVLWLGDRKAWA